MKINQVIIENNLTEDPKNWRPADPNNFDSDNDFYNARDQEDKEEDWYDDPEVDPDAWMDESVTQGTLRESDSPVASAITRRILLQRSDLLQKYGPEKVTAAIDDVADFVGDTEEIGSSDVSGWIKQVEQSLAGMDESVQQGVAEGWQEDSQELEDWSKEVNKRLYRAHESQRPALARQLSKLEQKNFGSNLNQGSLTELVHSALKAIQKGQMVHYDPQSVGQMPFGSIVGDEARMIAASGMKKYDIDGYRGLQRAGIVDNFQQFLHLRDLADNQGQAILKYTNMPPVAAWMQFIKDIGWSKDDMNEEVQAKTNDKLLAYYAQRKAEKQKQQQGMAEGGNANSGRRGPDYQDNSPVIPGRVEPLPQGLRHHADASRYGGTEPDDEDDRLLSPQQRHRLHRAVTPGDLDEQEKIAGRYDPDDFDDMIGRLKKLAGAGPLKTVYDPEKRVYKNVPHAVQPAQQPKKAQR
jgi:hypothetical protein